jgi:hypothetical protein
MKATISQNGWIVVPAELKKYHHECWSSECLIAAASYRNFTTLEYSNSLATYH